MAPHRSQVVSNAIVFWYFNATADNISVQPLEPGVELENAFTILEGDGVKGVDGLLLVIHVIDIGKELAQ